MSLYLKKKIFLFKIRWLALGLKFNGLWVLFQSELILVPNLTQFHFFSMISLNSYHEYEWFFKYLHVVARLVHSCRSGKNWYDNFSNEYLSKQSLNEPAGKSYLQQGFVSISHFHEENCIFVQNREQFTEKLVTDVSE